MSLGKYGKNIPGHAVTNNETKNWGKAIMNYNFFPHLLDNSNNIEMKKIQQGENFMETKVQIKIKFMKLNFKCRMVTNLRSILHTVARLFLQYSFSARAKSSADFQMQVSE